MCPFSFFYTKTRNSLVFKQSPHRGGKKKIKVDYVAQLSVILWSLYTVPIKNDS